MNSMSFRQSNTTKSYPDELEFICNRPALWCEPQSVSADYVPDGLAGSFENATRGGPAIARERAFSFRCSWVFPQPLCMNPGYGGVITRAFDGKNAMCMHRGFALTNDTSGHGLCSLGSISTRCRSPPVQLRPSLSRALTLSVVTRCAICRISVL